MKVKMFDCDNAKLQRVDFKWDNVGTEKLEEVSMKLYEVRGVSDDRDSFSHLTVATNKEEAIDSIFKKDDDYYPLFVSAIEITEVNGYTIQLVKENH